MIAVVLRCDQNALLHTESRQLHLLLLHVHVTQINPSSLVSREGLCVLDQPSDGVISLASSFGECDEALVGVEVGGVGEEDGVVLLSCVFPLGVILVVEADEATHAEAAVAELHQQSLQTPLNEKRKKVGGGMSGEEEESRERVGDDDGGCKEND